MKMSITISILETGQLQISGNIENPLLAFGLLEMGRHEIQKHHDKKTASPIIKAPLGLVVDHQ